MMILTGLLSLAWGQLKTNKPLQSSVEQQIRIPGLTSTSLGLKWLDANRFQMHQSYSLAVSAWGNQTASVGYYQNQTSYLVSEKMLFSARFGLMHDPLQLGNTPSGLNTNLLDQLSFGADLIYCPTDKMMLSIRFDRRPVTPGFGYRNPYYGYTSVFPFYPQADY